MPIHRRPRRAATTHGRQTRRGQANGALDRLLDRNRRGGGLCRHRPQFGRRHRGRDRREVDGDGVRVRRHADGNKGNYEPKDGAKFLATDTGTVYLGDGSSWQSAFELDAGGVPDEPTFTQLNPDGQFLGVGRDSPMTGAERFGIGVDVDDGAYGGMYVSTTGHGGWPFYGYAAGGDTAAWHYYDGVDEQWRLSVGGTDTITVNPSGSVGFGDDPWGGRITIAGGNGDERALLVDGAANVQKNLRVVGDLNVTGNKNFTQTVDTGDGPKEVVYTAAESPTPRTEATGVARLEDGRAEIDLPDHFGWVTSDEEPIHVQTTPYSVDSAGLAVVERGPDRLVVADLDGTGDYEFSYTVSGTRDGHGDKDVVREPGADRATDRLSPDAATGTPGDRVEGD